MNGWLWNLFCPFYEEKQWQLSPQDATNNVNGIGAVARTNVSTLDKHGGLLAVQVAMNAVSTASSGGLPFLIERIYGISAQT